MNGGGDHGNGRGGDHGDRGSSRDAGFDHGDAFGNNWGGDRGEGRRQRSWRSGQQRRQRSWRLDRQPNGDPTATTAIGAATDNSQFANFDRHGKDFHGDHFDRDNFRHNADSIRHDFHDRHDVPFRNGWWEQSSLEQLVGTVGVERLVGPAVVLVGLVDRAVLGFVARVWLGSALLLGLRAEWLHNLQLRTRSESIRRTCQPVTEQAQLPTTTNYNQAFDLAHSASGDRPGQDGAKRLVAARRVFGDEAGQAG